MNGLLRLIYGVVVLQLTFVSATLAISADSTAVYYYTTEQPNQKIYPDTTLTYFQNYHPAQTLPVDYLLKYDLGNIGLPLYTLQALDAKPFGFQLGRTAANAYRYQASKMPIYNSSHPFSELGYQTGQFGETMIQLMHTQPLGKAVKAQMNYRYLSSDGVYQLQKAIHHNFFGRISYQSKSKKYAATVGTVFNKLSWQENGGTTNDSVFLINYINKSVVPVKMANTFQTVKEETYFLQQNYHIGQKYTVKKSDTTIVPDFVPFYTLQHVFSSQSEYQHYSDKAFDSINYLPMPLQMPDLDTFHHKDSLVGAWVLHTYSNTFSLSTAPFKKRLNDSINIARAWLSSIAIQHQFIVAKQPLHSLNTQSINAHVALEHQNLPAHRNYNLALVADYAISGYNANDYLIKASASKIPLHWPLVIGINAQLQKRHADWLQNQLWTTALPLTSVVQPENRQQMRVFMNLYKMKLVVAFTTTRYQNLQVLDTAAVPINWTTPVVTNYWLFKYTFKIGKFNFDQLLYDFSKRATPLPQPRIAVMANWYYQNYLFKKALLLQTGFTATWKSDFKAPNYSPLWNEFYWQNSHTYSTIPVADVYVNLKIKSARIFIKMENLLQGVNGMANYNSYWYPQAERAIRVGVNWRFDDY